MEVLLFSTSFVISVLFSDVEMVRIGLFCVSPADKYRYIFGAQKSSGFFLAKGDLSSTIIS